MEEDRKYQLDVRFILPLGQNKAAELQALTITPQGKQSRLTTPANQRPSLTGKHNSYQ